MGNSTQPWVPGTGVLEHSLNLRVPAETAEGLWAEHVRCCRPAQEEAVQGGCSLQEDAEGARGVFTAPQSFGFVCWSFILLCLEAEQSSLALNLKSSQFSLLSAVTMPLCSASWLRFQGTKCLWLLYCPHPPSSGGAGNWLSRSLLYTDAWSLAAPPLPTGYLALLLCPWFHVLSHVL